MQSLLKHIPVPRDAKLSPPIQANCHNNSQSNLEGLPLVIIVGTPNVGKSVLFNSLSGSYATVSNYPGTSVEVTRGKAQIGSYLTGLIDTPGMFSLQPITEEERVARRVLFIERASVILHVIDAKNLERMLPMTLQLIEAGLPVILVVNLLDEADDLGIEIDLVGLRDSLGIPVVGTALAKGRGKLELKAAVEKVLQSGYMLAPGNPIAYPPEIESAISQVGDLLGNTGAISKRAAAIQFLLNDAEVTETASIRQQVDLEPIQRSIQGQSSVPVLYRIGHIQRQAAQKIAQKVFTTNGAVKKRPAARLSDAMIHPLTGLPILFLVILALYEFVGVFGAQTLVNWLETNLFDARFNPWVDQLLALWVPWTALRSLIGGEFGVVTLGMRYAFGIILPIVGTFFIAFAIIEDSGYLPRLAMLIDRVFKKIGLNGRAVIPMVLGLGCDTMATITTRTLETRRERVISTLLLSLAIPCSAQLGVMLALLSAAAWMLGAWLLVITAVFLLVGFLSARLLPGERPSFYMELPPLRLPRARNVLVKTYTRMEWYLREVFPLFILASVVIWIGTLTGLFDLAVQALVPLVTWLGLPEQTAIAFLFGFFRRDYGAAGLYDLQNTLSEAQMLVAVVTMTLFVPCLAQFAVAIKERGWKTALAMAAFIFPFALLVGAALSTLLRWFGMSL